MRTRYGVLPFLFYALQDGCIIHIALLRYAPVSHGLLHRTARLVPMLTIIEPAMLQFFPHLGKIMRQQFPLVNSFESRHEMQQVQAGEARATVRQSDSVVRDGHKSLSVVFSTEKYAGIRLLGPYGDWSDYQFLTMDFYNPEAERLELVIKISDYQHDSGGNLHGDRFNYPVVLMTGWNHVRIDLNELRSAPAGRDMQMDKITGFTVFALQLPTSREFYWDNIRLQ